MISPSYTAFVAFQLIMLFSFALLCALSLRNQDGHLITKLLFTMFPIILIIFILPMIVLYLLDSMCVDVLKILSVKICQPWKIYFFYNW